MRQVLQTDNLKLVTSSYQRQQCLIFLLKSQCWWSGKTGRCWCEQNKSKSTSWGDQLDLIFLSSGVGEGLSDGAVRCPFWPAWLHIMPCSCECKKIDKDNIMSSCRWWNRMYITAAMCTLSLIWRWFSLLQAEISHTVDWGPQQLYVPLIHPLPSPPALALTCLCI